MVVVLSQIHEQIVLLLMLDRHTTFVDFSIIGYEQIEEAMATLTSIDCYSIPFYKLLRVAYIHKLQTQ
jgi:hypothetical protein